MEDILGGSDVNEAQTAAGSFAGQAKMMRMAEPPTIKQRLEHEIAVTEHRLKAMKAGLEVIETAPALEVLQRALTAVNRHNY